MICPNCRNSLLAKQRGGRKCSICKHRFAFDPKTNPLRLHDLRMRDLIGTLGGKGREGQPPLAYTVDQLRYAASRKILAKRTSSGSGIGCAIAALVVGGGFVTVAVANGGGSMAALAAVPVVILLVGVLVRARLGWFPGHPVSRPRFARMLTSWQQVYGEPPRGLLPDLPAQVVVPAAVPRAVLFCPDGPTVRFLEAAGVAQRHPVVLVPLPTALPRAAAEGLPVLVLHDAGVAGCVWVPRLRAALAGAAVLDIGLRPRVATRGGPALRLRPAQPELEELRVAVGRGLVDLDDAEFAWLAEGNVLPLAAVLPSRLVRAVERAVHRAVDRPDPDQVRARALGFLSGPEAA